MLRQYTRVTFHKDRVSLPGKPQADFLVPGHPLLDAVLEGVLEAWGEYLERGTVLVDENATKPRLVLALEHEVEDAQGPVSRRLLYVGVGLTGEVRAEGPAPYLDLRPATEEERRLGLELAGRLDLPGLLDKAEIYAVERLAREHLEEVRSLREREVDRTLKAVRERLLSEIWYWDGRAAEEEKKAQAGKAVAKARAEGARRRAEELRERLRRREEELLKAKHLRPLPPRLTQAIWVIPPLAQGPPASRRRPAEG